MAWKRVGLPSTPRSGRAEADGARTSAARAKRASRRIRRLSSRGEAPLARRDAARGAAGGVEARGSDERVGRLRRLVVPKGGGVATAAEAQGAGDRNEQLPRRLPLHPRSIGR